MSQLFECPRILGTLVQRMESGADHRVANAREPSGDSSFVYAIGFVGNVIVPRTIDAGPSAPFAEAVIIDLLLLGAFAIQHSVMARPGFKAVWTRIVPRSVERSTYVLLSSLFLGLMCWQWRPIPATVCDVSGSPLAAGLLRASSGSGGSSCCAPPS